MDHVNMVHILNLDMEVNHDNLPNILKLVIGVITIKLQKYAGGYENLTSQHFKISYGGYERGAWSGGDDNLPTFSK